MTHDALDRIRRQLALTRLGLWAERITHALWPAWTALFLGVAVWASGVVAPLWEASLIAALGVLALVLAVLGLRGFRAPTRAEAAARLDATLPGRPIATLSDDLAIGAADAGARSVWAAHRERLARRLGAARAVAPDLRVSRRDPYALRYMALLLAAVAVTFGTLLRVPAAPVLPGGAGGAVAAGPAWEGWLQPPRHTGLPTLYLNEIAPGTVAVPEGTQVTLRLYGQPGALSVSETVSGRAEVNPAEPIQEFAATRSGTLAIDGAETAPLWSLDVLPDAAPTVTLAGEPGFEHPATTTLPWAAEDDHGITAARIRLALDLAAVDRRHGLAADPEPIAPIEMDMALPIAGSRDAIRETFRADLAKHPLAGLPVRATLEVSDAAAQTGTAEAAIVLPAKPFYDPMAAALVEMRRDLLWSRENRRRTAQVLRAVSWRGDDTFDNPSAYLIVRMAIRKLEGVDALDVPLRDEIAEMLWEAATRLEENSLDSALERLRQAEERLSEAIRNGAPPEEIERLMAEMRQAMDDYTRQLAQQGGQQGQQQQAEGETQEVTPDMLDQMMERIEELMAQGRTAEAQELLRQLQEMMENLQVTQGQGSGQGGQQQSQGEQSMDDLRDTLREQQGLSDDAFRELQEQFDPAPGQGEQQGQQQGQGQQPGQDGQQGEGQQPGQQGQGQQPGTQGGQGQAQGEPGGGTTPEALARRQGQLRRQLDGLREGLPQTGGEAGERAAEALDRAGRAMDDAESDLAEGNLGGALDDQARAMDALRDGMQELGRALAEERQDGQPGQGQGQAAERTGDGFRRDPLGRRSGEGARLGTDEEFLGGIDAARRARELMDEIRRRSGERERPEVELDYLRRLLERF
ncbi:DUF4175 domain-containing protein [Jannaschia sp. W003]|uniref:DUF4175 domain-containing protein n=1 Tax=Jannaschia sp. W003 TaxID=2867012 RepID=UPI0021A44808|nr:DUF4175 domain-containing protein [Jannaschia sp. W003]UWQ22592.1 DUF4175 domain-containing protein [Jannaschia sp. W003]